MISRLTRFGGLALVAGVATGLVFGVLTGLSRMGWAVGTPPAVSFHGPLFALGFLGTVIGVERAVALRRRWAWVVPAASAAAVVSFLAGAPTGVPASLLAVGGRWPHRRLPHCPAPPA